MYKVVLGCVCLMLLVVSLEDCTQAKMDQKPQKDTVIIKQMKFDPAEITIHKGDTIVFINEDLVTHDVTDQTNKDWSSGPMKTGDSWETVPTKNIDYYCSIHVVMKGKIVTKE